MYIHVPTLFQKEVKEWIHRGLIPVPMGGRGSKGKALDEACIMAEGPEGLKSSPSSTWAGYRSFGESLSKTRGKVTSDCYAPYVSTIVLGTFIHFIFDGIFPFYRWGKWDSKELSNFSHGSWMAGLIQMVLWFQSLCSFYYIGPLPKRVLSSRHLWKTILLEVILPENAGSECRKHKGPSGYSWLSCMLF